MCALEDRSASSSSHPFMYLNTLVLFVFLFFASLPLSGAELMFPLASCPSARNHVWEQGTVCWGSTQPRQVTGICAQHPVQTQAALEECFVFQMCGPKSGRSFDFSVPIRQLLCRLTPNLVFLLFPLHPLTVYLHFPRYQQQCLQTAETDERTIPTLTFIWVFF